MQTPQRFGKVALQKALKERLAVLTQSLAEAEKGQKGIELVKEMKELHSMLESMYSEKLRDNTKKEAPQYHIFTWGPVQVLPESVPHTPATAVCENTAHTDVPCKDFLHEHDLNSAQKQNITIAHAQHKDKSNTMHEATSQRKSYETT